MTVYIRNMVCLRCKMAVESVLKSLKINYRSIELGKVEISEELTHEQPIMNLLYKNGAQYYIRKPNNYDQLKIVIQLALTLTEQKDIQQPSRENFVLSSQPIKDGNKY